MAKQRSGEVVPLVWMYRDGWAAAVKARAETEANPTGTGWLVVPVPHQVEPNCWIVGRADALAELVSSKVDAAQVEGTPLALLS